jgi:hypothetical protein
MIYAQKSLLTSKLEIYPKASLYKIFCFYFVSIYMYVHICSQVEFSMWKLYITSVMFTFGSVSLTF